MPRYIDADALYEQTAEWEARALAICEKLISKPLEEMDADEITKWRKWSCILNERSAFMYVVADAPTVDVVGVVRCKDCKHFQYDHWEKVNRVPLILAHEICTKWGEGCKTSEDGYCFLAERKEVEDE